MKRRRSLRLAPVLTRAFLFASLLGPLIGGCSGSGSGKSYRASELVIDTELSTAFAAPGAEVGVTCRVTHYVEGPLDLDTVVLVTPSEGVRVQGHVLVGDAFGMYDVACALASEPAVRDTTPARLGITPMGVATVDTLVDPPQIVAGERAEVRCVARTAGGAEVSAPMGFTLQPSEAGLVDAAGVEGRVAGTHAVACFLSELPAVVDPSPAALEVTPGPLAKTVASLPESSFAAGQTATVECRGEDAYGNPVALEAPSARVEPSPGVVVNGSILQMQTAGAYQVYCAPADGPTGLEQVGAGFTVGGGPAAGVSIHVDPTQPAYAPGDQVAVSWSVVDVYGNDLGAADGTLTPPTAGVTDLGAGAFRLDAEGIHTFRVDVVSPPLHAERALVVDARGPTLVITEPARGSTIDGDGVVTVKGYVYDDTTDVSQLLVGGKLVTVAPDGTFSTTVSSDPALNLLKATAKDGAGNQSDTSVAWYYSTAWQPYHDTTLADVVRPGAVHMYLGQDVIDDGVHDHDNVNDLATLIELILKHADIAALAQQALPPQVIPNIIALPLGSIPIPFTNQTVDFFLSGDAVIWLKVDNFQVGPNPTISLQARDGGLDLSGSFPPAPGFAGLAMGLSLTLEFPITVTATIPGIGDVALGINPSAYSITYATADSMSFYTSYDISKASGQPLQVLGKAFQLQVQGLKIQPFQNAQLDLGQIKIDGLAPIDLGTIPLDGLIGPIGDFVGDLVGPLAEFLINVVTPLIEPLVAQVAADVLKAVLESVEIEDTLAIPGVLGGPDAELELALGLDTVSFTKAGGFLGLSGGVWAEQGVDRDPLGLMLRDKCLGLEPGEFAFSGANPMGAALGFDFLNGLFFGVWWNGFLNLAADGAALAELAPDIANFGVKFLGLQPTLPPVITDCNGKSLLKLQLADALVSVDVDFLGVLIQADVYATIEADIAIVATGDALGLKINGFTVMHFDAVSVNDYWIGKEHELENMLKGLLESQLEDLLGDALDEIPLPALDLSGVLPGIPEGTTMQMSGIQSFKTKGYISLEGGL